MFASHPRTKFKFAYDGLVSRLELTGRGIISFGAIFICPQQIAVGIRLIILGHAIITPAQPYRSRDGMAAGGDRR